jgi:hypothetical protein
VIPVFSVDAATYVGDVGRLCAVRGLGDVVCLWLGRCEFFVDKIKTHDCASCAEGSGNGPKPPDFVCRAVLISDRGW